MDTAVPLEHDRVTEEPSSTDFADIQQAASLTKIHFDNPRCARQDLKTAADHNFDSLRRRDAVDAATRAQRVCNLNRLQMSETISFQTRSVHRSSWYYILSPGWSPSTPQTSLCHRSNRHQCLVGPASNPHTEWIEHQRSSSSACSSNSSASSAIQRAR